MTRTKDRWKLGERVRHPEVGAGRIDYVHPHGIAVVHLDDGRTMGAPTIQTAYASARGWRRDPQTWLFDEDERAALMAAGCPW